MKSTIHAGMSTAVCKAEAHLPPGALSNKGSETCKRVSFNICAFLGIAVGFKIICFQTKAAKDLETFEGVFGNCQHSGERFRRDNETFNESQGKGFFLIFTGPRCLWGPVYGSRSL